MADTLQDPRQNPPSKTMVTLGKISGGLSIASGAINLIGAIVMPRTSSAERVGMVVGGGIGLAVGLAVWKLASYAGLVREANYRDKLLLEKLEIDKKLEESKARSR